MLLKLQYYKTFQYNSSVFVFILLVLQPYLVDDPDVWSIWKRSALCWCLLHPRSEEIVFEEIVQDLWFVSHFLSWLFTVENLTSKREGIKFLHAAGPKILKGNQVKLNVVVGTVLEGDYLVYTNNLKKKYIYALKNISHVKVFQLEQILEDYFLVLFFSIYVSWF